MPRSLDRDQRLAEVTQAAWRVIARSGMEALSVRNVATEAGLPPSSLRYVVSTQAELRELAIEASLARLNDRLASLDRTIPDWPVALLQQFLPLDSERHLEMEVYVALGTAALTDPGLRPARLRCEARIKEACDEALSELCRRRGVDVRLGWGTLLHALLDGLALQVIHQSPDDSATWAAVALDHYLLDIGLYPASTEQR